MKTLKYGIKHIEGGDKAKDLPLAMKQSAESIVNALDKFNYNGKDPNLVLARVAALEALVGQTPAEKRITHEVHSELIPGLTWPGVGDGWAWTGPIDVKFPPGLFTEPPVVTTPSVWASGFLLFAMLTSAPTKDGFGLRIVKKTTTALASAHISYTASQKLE